jgi:DNA-binding transcriptional LysR family regulator
VSVAAVRAALRTLVPLSEARDGLDVASRGFVAAAAQLGVSPAQLARAIAVLKAAG